MAKNEFGDEIVEQGAAVLDQPDFNEFGDLIQRDNIDPIAQAASDVIAEFRADKKVKADKKAAVDSLKAEEREVFRQSVLDDIILKPEGIGDDVIRRGEISAELLKSIGEPEDLKKDLENRIMLSELFGVPYEDVDMMDKPSLELMFDDPLTSLSERFKKEPLEGGFFKKMGESVKRGNAAVSSDIAVYQAGFEGKGNLDETLEARNKMELGQLLSPIEGNLMTNLFYKSAQLLPAPVRGFYDAIPKAMGGMVAGAATAGVAGQLGPQVALPEEIITVPAGAAIGFKTGISAGGATFWWKQGAGSTLASMLEQGYDREISTNVAGIAAIPYALIELSQVSAVTPGLRQGITKAINDTAVKVIGKAVKKYGTTLTKEVLQEVGQEIIVSSAEDVSGILSEADIEFDKDYIIDRSARLWQTAVESTQAMALLPVPGTAIDVVTGVRSAMSQAEIAKINSKLPEIGAIPAALQLDPASELALQLGREDVATPAVETPAEPTTVTPTEESGLESLTDAQIDEIEKAIPDITAEQRASLKEQRDAAIARRDVARAGTEQEVIPAEAREVEAAAEIVQKIATGQEVTDIETENIQNVINRIAVGEIQIDPESGVTQVDIGNAADIVLKIAEGQEVTEIETQDVQTVIDAAITEAKQEGVVETELAELAKGKTQEEFKAEIKSHPDFAFHQTGELTAGPARN
jgi:hypothetical protein